VLPLDFLGILLSHVMLLGIEMSLVGPPAVSVILRDAKGLQQLLQPQEDSVLPPFTHRRSYLPGVVINRVPAPSWMRFRLHKTPHCVELRAQSTPHLKLIRAPDVHLDLRGMQDRQRRMMHRLQRRLFFFSALMTVVGRTWSTPAVSRMPLAFIAMLMICCFTSAD
jgi:hypothetical protein